MNDLTHVRGNCIHYKCKAKRGVRVEMLSAPCVLLCVSHEFAVHVHLPRTHLAIIICLAMNFNSSGRSSSSSSNGTENVSVWATFAAYPSRVVRFVDIYRICKRSKGARFICHISFTKELLISDVICMKMNDNNDDVYRQRRLLPLNNGARFYPLPANIARIERRS